MEHTLRCLDQIVQQYPAFTKMNVRSSFSIPAHCSRHTRARISPRHCTFTRTSIGGGGGDVTHRERNLPRSTQTRKLRSSQRGAGILLKRLRSNAHHISTGDCSVSRVVEYYSVPKQLLHQLLDLPHQLGFLHVGCGYDALRIDQESRMGQHLSMAAAAGGYFLMGKNKLSNPRCLGANASLSGRRDDTRTISSHTWIIF